MRLNAAACDYVEYLEDVFLQISKKPIESNHQTIAPTLHTKPQFRVSLILLPLENVHRFYCSETHVRTEELNIPIPTAVFRELGHDVEVVQ